MSRIHVPIESQLGIVAAHLERTRTVLIEALTNDFAWKELTRLCLERGATIGDTEYDDASFHKTPRQLDHETCEELADAIWYTAISQWKQRSRPLPASE